MLFLKQKENLIFILKKYVNMQVKNANLFNSTLIK